MARIGMTMGGTHHACLCVTGEQGWPDPVPPKTVIGVGKAAHGEPEAASWGVARTGGCAGEGCRGMPGNADGMHREMRLVTGGEKRRLISLPVSPSVLVID